MSAIIKFLAQDRTIWFAILISLGILIVSAALITLSYWNLPPLLPLFNQLPWGVDRLSSKLGLFIPVIIATSMIGINILVTYYIYEKIPTVARLLNISGLVVSSLTLFFIFRTIQLIL